MKDKLLYEYGKIPEKNRKAIEELQERVEKLKSDISNSKAELDIVKGEMVLLLTDIRVGDLVKHDKATKSMGHSGEDSVYLVAEMALEFSGLQFYGRKLRKDGVPTERVTRLYTGLDGELIKVGRRMRGRTLICGS